jgi:hypothetical protein
MYMSKQILLILFFSYWHNILNAQIIQIQGKVVDQEDSRLAVSACIVVNMRTQQGFLADESGSFTMNIYKTDTLAFRNIGYELKFIYLKDSIIEPGYKMTVKLKKQAYQVKEVMIMPEKSLNKIGEDIEKLGYDESKYQLQGLDAIQSPVTAIYQAFSRKERSKREVAFMLNEDERKKLLRELLHYYEVAGFISLPSEKYDDFISYCHINDAQLKTLTQYEMAVFIKKKLELYKAGRY